MSFTIADTLFAATRAAADVVRQGRPAVTMASTHNASVSDASFNVADSREEGTMPYLLGTGSRANAAPSLLVTVSRMAVTTSEKNSWISGPGTFTDAPLLAASYHWGEKIAKLKLFHFESIFAN